MRICVIMYARITTTTTRNKIKIDQIKKINICLLLLAARWLF